MSTLPTRVEREAGRRLAASEIANITAVRKKALSRMLMLYISTGVVFMLICEMLAVTAFAFNLLITFARPAPAVAAQPLREAG